MENLPLTLEERVNPKHSAIMVVDLQNDYAHEEGVYARAGCPVTYVQGVVQQTRKVVNAAHHKGVLVIYTRNWKTQWNVSKVCRDRDSRHIVGPSGIADTWGADWYGLEPTANDVIINKARHDAFLGTNLDQVLRSLEIKTLIFTGIQTNVCVESTARSAFMRGYYVVVLEDATATNSEKLQSSSLENIASYFGVVLSVDEILAVWNKAAS